MMRLSLPPRQATRGLTPPSLFVLALLALLLLDLPGSARPAQAFAAAPADLQPCAGSIAPGTTIACAIGAAAEVDSVTLSGSSGEIYLIRVAVTAGDMRPLVRVYAPDSSTICQASSPYSVGAEIARCALAQSGAQTIRISG